MCVCGEAGVCLGVLSDAGAGVCVCGEAGVCECVRDAGRGVYVCGDAGVCVCVCVCALGLAMGLMGIVVGTVLILRVRCLGAASRRRRAM